MSFARIAAAVSTLGFAFAVAAPADTAEFPMRSERLYVTYVVNPDGSRVETRELAARVLSQKAVELAKQTSIGYSTSVERAEIVEAYTRKPDGKRIDVPKANYQLGIQKGRDADAPAFSDRTQLSLIFPDVAVNDVLVMKYRVTETEAMFPGHFSINERFSRFYPYEDVKVRIESPEGMWSQYSATDMEKTVDAVADGRRVLEWTWKNPAPGKSKRRDYSVYDPDKEPGYSFSTFRSYGEIAEAYGKRARPKAAVGARVREIAETATRGITGEREQAKALYEWVATNIHYAGNCVGVGAVVPRDQEFVLDNKMGDCKDQATLLQALLAAKNIASTQALVNSGSTYRLPKIPVISMVNHVIVYVPSLDVYLDPTSRTTPFGMLPLGDADKPVLLVDNYRDGTRTPAVKSSANSQRMKANLTVKPDGSIAGAIEVDVTGVFAVSGRDRLRDMTAEQKEERLKELYRRDNKTGFGRLENDDPAPMLNRFHYKVTFETEEFTQMPGPGAFSIQPLYQTEAPIHMIAAMTEAEPEAEETACVGGSLVEEYTYELPKGTKVLAVPKNVSLSSGPTTYRATYSLRGGTLSVKRELVDKTDRNVCPIAIQREYAAFARKVLADLKAQVVYQ
jgi:transglutaminase-like putative cysteine protease